MLEWITDEEPSDDQHHDRVARDGFTVIVVTADSYLTYEEVLERLRARVQALGSQALLAKEAGVSYQLLNDVIHRRSQRLGPKLLAGLRLRAVVLYAPLVQGTPPPDPSKPTAPQEPSAGG